MTHLSKDTVVAFIGVPYDGAATLGWPGSRYAPAEIRRHLEWMSMRVQDGGVYWVDEDRIVPFHPAQMHDPMATPAAARAKTCADTRAGRVPSVVARDDRILFAAGAGVP